MKHLQKISISNARRFGKEIEIEFGQGATIIQAPNGTGKTTIFEAIEFALTGSIRRIDNPPLSLIRDNQSGLDVRLDFTENKYCEVKYRKGQEPILTGHQSTLYNNRNKEAIPFLLRLTHLLEQRGTNWFVGANTEAAGNLLDKLSIGKELNHVFSKKASVLRAITKEKEDIRLRVEKAKQELIDFESLLEKRNKFSLKDGLVPLKDIINKIQHYYSLLTNEKEVFREDVTTVFGFLNHTKSKLSTSLDDYSSRIKKLSELEEQVDHYLSNQSIVVNKQEILKELDTTERNLNENIIFIKKEIQTKSDYLLTNKEDYSLLLAIQGSFKQQDSEIIERDRLEKEIVNLKETIEGIVFNLSGLTKEIEDVNVSLDNDQIISLEIKKAYEKKGQIANLEELQKEWQSILDEITDLQDNLIPILLKQKLEEEAKLNEYKNIFEIAQTELNKKQATLDLLRKTSDEIQDAVSVIASNLPDDKRDCPLCGTDFDPNELRIRILSALEKVNPLISSSVEETKVASEHLNLIISKLNDQKDKLDKVLLDLNSNQQKLIRNKDIINQKILPHFPMCETIEDALIQNIKSKTEIEKLIKKLTDTQKLFDRDLTNSRLNNIVLKKQEDERTLETLNKNLDGHTFKLIVIKDHLEDLKIKLANKDRNHLKSEIEIKETLINELQFTIDEAFIKQKNLQLNLEEIKSKIVAEKHLVSQLVSQQNGILSIWDNLQLGNKISKESLLKAKDQLIHNRKLLSDSINPLSIIEEELSFWKTAETFDNYDKEIKEKISNDNEANYIEKLKNNLQTLEGRFQFITTRTEAVNTLFMNINNELSTVHEYLKSINPLWCSLLKRVVVNPRFAETTLNSYSKHNKPLANVKAKLHGQDVNVADIASEAQLTDLQLTFMLSMAKNYQWTPWKALLLDDPTQHHDLVHSAAVFDLLRDYILDLDYQVLLGTHDAVQANFFQRKLYNDGIDAKIYALRADDNGVIAECIK